VADRISFGIFAGQDNGTVTADGGAGADAFEFGAHAHNLTIDLGEGDEAEDSVTFEGAVYNATIANWEVGLDVVSVQGNWTGHDDGTNTTFTNGNQAITFLEVTGLVADVDTFFI
jgi:bacillopeptidase F (M6 metalloprotease family)